MVKVQIMLTIKHSSIFGLQSSYQLECYTVIFTNYLRTAGYFDARESSQQGISIPESASMSGAPLWKHIKPTQPVSTASAQGTKAGRGGKEALRPTTYSTVSVAGRLPRLLGLETWMMGKGEGCRVLPFGVQPFVTWIYLIHNGDTEHVEE